MNSSSESNAMRTIGALALIVIGGLFLAGQVFNFNPWAIFDIAWPFYIIIPGALMLAAAVFGGRGSAGLAVPGAVIGGTGAILLYQETFNNYESWAYMWALYPVFVGLAIAFMGTRQGNSQQVRDGWQIVTIGGLVFLAFAAFFELAIFGGFGGLGNILLPLALIGLGVFLLMRRGGRGATGEKPKNPPTFTGARNIDGPRYPSGAEIDPNLRRQIDEALAERDPDQPRTR